LNRAHKPIEPPPRPVIEEAVRNALAEDLGRAGDITSNATVPADALAEAAVVARGAGVIAGLDVARAAFSAVDSSIAFDSRASDGDAVPGGAVLAIVSGAARAILAGERVALNFLGHLSGIATATAALVACTADTAAKISCTRKTTPGLRALEKYAVRCGGGVNHRFGLYDAVLIKDNHIAVVGGVAKAIRKARSTVGSGVEIEVEVDSLDQLIEAMTEAPDAVLLDNMTPTQLREAVLIVGGRSRTEASGSVRPDTVRRIAESGVDIISSGWITHSAPALDVALDFILQGKMSADR
jgi:nicotinate-nucleotide pyrophosphorylase (carboxylating)